jgi:uncharacterized NAD-dependent epimerase/dehydratase family protein
VSPHGISSKPGPRLALERDPFHIPAPMEIARPYLMFLGDVGDQLAAKTAHGVVDWRPGWCAGQQRLAGCVADCGLPEMTLAEAVGAGVRTMVIGVVNPGGHLPKHWVERIVEALNAGLDVAAGLHTRLGSVPEIAAAAARCGRTLHDVRHCEEIFAVGKGSKRPGLRLLTVGTDCSVGKKYTALAIARELEDRGVDADFRATGQTGVLIAGRGVAIDAVVSDFLSGAVEWLTPAAAPGHWDIIEGQGSLFHPSFAAVTLGLLHGAQPDAFVVCHEPTRANMRGVSNSLPTIESVIEQTIRMGRLTNEAIACVGIAVNTGSLDEGASLALLEELQHEHGVPTVDPMRGGVATLVDHLQQRFP